MQPAALPAPDNPETWDDLKQPNTPHYPRLPFPAARSSGSRPATSRTPPAPPPGGRAPPGSLTCPAARHRHASYQGTGDASHACPAEPLNPQNPSSRHLDTTPLLQG